jgi:TrmH family RNA methyltransferase
LNRWRGKSFKGSARSAPVTQLAAAGRLTSSELKLIRWGKRDGLRDSQRGILLEGSKLIEEALSAGHPLEAVWFTAEFAESTPNLIDRIRDAVPRIRQIPAREMQRISSLETPPGIVAIASEPGFIRHEPGDAISLIIILMQVQDPGNLGGVIRTADFFGVDEIWLGPGSADPYNPKTIRGGMGAVFRMPVIRVDNLGEKIGKFRDAGAKVWAAVARPEGAERSISASGARILLIGGESRGLSDAELELADHRVFIPGARRSESLNLAVAAGILIYNATTGRWKPESN